MGGAWFLPDDHAPKDARGPCDGGECLGYEIVRDGPEYRTVAAADLAADPLYRELRRDAGATAAAAPLKSWNGKDVWRWTFADHGRSRLYVVGGRWFAFFLPSPAAAAVPRHHLPERIPADFIDLIVTLQAHTVDGELPTCALCLETIAGFVLPCLDARTGESVGKHRLCDECAIRWIRSHARSLDAWYANTIRTEAEALMHRPQSPVLACPLCRYPFDIDEILPLSRLAVDRRRHPPPPSASSVDLAALRAGQIRRRNERRDAQLRELQDRYDECRRKTSPTTSPSTTTGGGAGARGGAGGGGIGRTRPATAAAATSSSSSYHR
jgi:hypothetical protein